MNCQYVAAVTPIGDYDAECNQWAAYLDLPKPYFPTAQKHVNDIFEIAQMATDQYMQQAAHETTSRLAKRREL